MKDNFVSRTLNNDFGRGPGRAGRTAGLADVPTAVALADGSEPEKAASRVHADRQPRLALLRPGNERTQVQLSPLIWSTDVRSTRLYGQFLCGPNH